MAIPIKAILSVSTKQFVKGMSGATKMAAGFAGIITKVGLAVAGLTGVFAAFIIRQAQLIDRIGKVAKTTGISAETLQKFSFAAEQAGVSTDQAQVALRRFSRRLGEAQRGTGELAPTLKRLGINLKDSNGQFKTAEAVLLEFADGIANTEGESNKLSLAFKAFDSEGAELVTTLNGGSAALLEMFEKAEALGGVLSTDAIQGVENFNDSLNELQTLIGGVANNFTAALAPALEQVVDDLTNFILETADANNGIEGLGNYFKNTFLDVMQNVIISFAMVGNAIIGLLNLIGEFVVQLDRLPGIDLKIDEKQAKKIQDLKDQLKDLDDQRAALSKNAIKALGPFPIPKMAPRNQGSPAVISKEDKEALDAYNLALRNIMTGVDLPGMDELNEKMKSIQTQIFDTMQAEGNPFFIQPINLENIVAYLETLKTVVNEQEENTDEVEKELTFREKLNKLLKEAGERLASYRELTIDWIKIFDNLKTRLGTPLDRLNKTLEDGLVKGVEMFEDALTDAVLTGKLKFSDLGDHLKATLAKAMVQKFISGPILALFGLAGGGPAKAGQPYIVGEEGPELFIPNNSGTVIPNDITEAMSGGPAFGGGGATNVNYTINATSAESFQQLVARDPAFIYAVTQAGARSIPGAR